MTARSCREIGNCGNRREATGQRYAKHFPIFNIKIMIYFKCSKALFQANILYGSLPLYRVIESYCISCICKYVAYINM